MGDGIEAQTEQALDVAQALRLELVVRHSAAHSPFYRQWFAQTGALGAEPVDLARLPVLDKSLLMAHFDELVCDPRLRRNQLLDHAGQLRGKLKLVIADPTARPAHTNTH